MEGRARRAFLRCSWNRDDCRSRYQRLELIRNCPRWSSLDWGVEQLLPFCLPPSSHPLPVPLASTCLHCDRLTRHLPKWKQTSSATPPQSAERSLTQRTPDTHRPLKTKPSPHRGLKPPTRGPLHVPQAAVQHCQNPVLTYMTLRSPMSAASVKGFAFDEIYCGEDICFHYSGLLPGATYYFRVRCHNAAGWGPWSDTVKCTTALGR